MTFSQKSLLLIPALIVVAGCSVFQSSSSKQSSLTVGKIDGAVVAMCLPLPHQLVAVSEDSGVVRSTDDGMHWEPWATGLPTHYVSAFVVNTRGDVFAATIGNGIYRRLAGAAEWTRTDTNAPKDALMRVPALAISRTDNILYAATLEHGIYKSTDNGVTWRNFNVGLGIMNINAITCTDDNMVYARCVGGGIFRHGPQWDEWKPINEGLSDPYVTTVGTVHTLTVIAGTRNGKAFLLNDKKSEWEDLSASLPGYYVTVVGSMINGILLAGTKSGLYRYSRATQLWTLVDPAFEAVNVRSIVTDNTGTIYVGADTGEIMKITIALD